jgi:hypothetical protein
MKTVVSSLLLNKVNKRHCDCVPSFVFATVSNHGVHRVPCRRHAGTAVVVAAAAPTKLPVSREHFDRTVSSAASGTFHAANASPRGVRR